MRFPARLSTIVAAAFTLYGVTFANTIISVGYSPTAEGDLARAGTAAAKMAFDSLKGNPCKLAIVYVAGEVNDPDPALHSVFAYFDSTKVYGATQTRVIAGGNKDRKVAVAAWSGDFSFYAFVPTQKNLNADSAFAGGKAMGTYFAGLPVAQGARKAIFGYGPGLHNNDDRFVLGLRSSLLGDAVPFSGVGSHNIIYQGRVLPGGHEETTLGLMIAGTFTGLYGMVESDDGSRTGTAARSATGTNKNKLSIAMVFDCTSRDGVPNELDTLKSVFGEKTPIFGCTGHGEMGKTDGSTPATGGGFRICISTLTFDAGTMTAFPPATHHLGGISVIRQVWTGQARRIPERLITVKGAKAGTAAGVYVGEGVR